MRGQRGRLPVKALGYVNSTKVILGLLKTAGVHFLLRPQHYMQTGGNAVLSGQQKQRNVPAGRVIKVVAARLSWTMPCGFFKWSLRAHGLGH